LHLENLIYFLTFGLPPTSSSSPSPASSNFEVVLILNGPHTAHAYLPDNPRLTVLERDNTCFDFGAWGAGISFMHKRLRSGLSPLRGAGEPQAAAYDYYIFLNGSVRGPLFPPYMKRLHDRTAGCGAGDIEVDGSTTCPSPPRPFFFDYVHLFTSLLSPTVKLVGTTFSCHIGDPSSYHLQSMFLATDSASFSSIMEPFVLSSPGSDTPRCYPNKVDAIYGAELPLTQRYLSAGHSVLCLASAPHLGGPLPVSLSSPTDPSSAVGGSGGSVKGRCDDWRLGSASRLGDPYYGEGGQALVDPYEVVFFKMNRRTISLGGRPTTLSGKCGESTGGGVWRRATGSFRGRLGSSLSCCC
jgi:hypothetical protein